MAVMYNISQYQKMKSNQGLQVSKKLSHWLVHTVPPLITASILSMPFVMERDLVIKSITQFATFYKWNVEVMAKIYTWVWQEFSVLDLVLTESLLHPHGTFDSCNQYVNCTSKNIYCALYTSSEDSRHLIGWKSGTVPAKMTVLGAQVIRVTCLLYSSCRNHIDARINVITQKSQAAGAFHILRLILW